MNTYTIESETNNITAHATGQEAEAVANAERFRTEAGFAKLAADWPTGRLVEIWNSIPGVIPVNKFKDRQTAVSRIWKAIQGSGKTVSTAATQQPDIAEPKSDPTPDAPQRADVAPAQALTTKKATRAQKSPKPAQKAHGSRQGSKTATVLELLKREGGVTSNELMTATGWQAHSVRGFISGTIGKKMGLTVVSTKTESGERSYSIKA